MKLSKEKALRITRELWIWMFREGKTSALDKAGWPGWDKYGNMYGECPCCEYENQTSEAYFLGSKCINSCLLRNIWPGGCMSGPSPFLSFTNEVGTPADALKIIRGCEDALRKLGKAVPTYRVRKSRRNK